MKPTKIGKEVDVKNRNEKTKLKLGNFKGTLEQIFGKFKNGQKKQCLIKTPEEVIARRMGL